MEVRLIKNEEFMSLADLTVKMYSAIDSKINAYQAVNTLMAYINTGKNFTAVGLFTDDNKLVGMVTGLEFDSTTFYYSGIYMSVKNSEFLDRLIRFSFDYVQGLGYKAWEVDATNENITSIMEKYGASARYVRYRKEFE